MKLLQKKNLNFYSLYKNFEKDSNVELGEKIKNFYIDYVKNIV